MDPKIGVFICEGCEIGKSLDIDKLKEHATGEAKAAYCATHKAYCSPEGVHAIRDAIGSEGLNRVSIAACSGRVFADLFHFGPEVMVDRTSLREYVAWCHEPNDEDTQMLAEDYVAMSCAKLVNSALPEVKEPEISKDILVIGGGVTGMQAALNVANAGYKAVLVEKEAELGGWSRKFYKLFPKKAPYKDLEDTRHEAMAAEVENNPNITVHKSTTVKRTNGQPGEFDVTLQNGSGEQQIKIGAIIQATGWRQYPTKKLEYLGYGQSPNVITNIEMEEMAKSGKIELPTGGTPKSVAFIQCAGSRDKDYMPYCSAVCCRVSLKQAKYVREKYPDCRVYIIYKDVRSPQQYELFYMQAQADDGIFLTKGEVQKVAADNGKITIDVSETLLGEDIQVEADMVVLASGMVSSAKVGNKFIDIGPMEKELLIGQSEDEKDETDDPPPEVAEAVLEGGKKAASGAEPGAHILNLSYRQGTDLPTLKYGFPDSHFICFPYETRRTGIYAAGPVRAPMDIASSINDAYGASLKAIQAVEAISKGKAVHPRSGDLSEFDFFMQRCTQCKRCTEECPFGTLDEDEKGTPLPNPNRCRRCGICLGACPERIITFKNYNIVMHSKMIGSISMPDEFDEKPRILIFVCENDAMPALDMVGQMRMKYSPFVRFIPVRCIGSTNVIWLNDALSKGFDGVMLLGCKKGDDYQCHFVKGSQLAATRMTNVQDKLKQLALESERVEIHEIQISDYDKIPKLIDDFVESIETMGYNPFKGM
jgi:quinone-modifying oxidoreductase subunit QmoB